MTGTASTTATPSPALGTLTSTTGDSFLQWDRGFYALVALAAICTVGTIQIIAFRVPVEPLMGVVQKIFYFHIPAAYSMYVGAAACFVGSAAYLYTANRAWDALAKAGAEVAVAMGFMVLISGSLWTVKAWGVYWTWDPHLTTSMLSVLLYVSYVVLRLFTGDGDAGRKFAAALGVLGAANLPVIHFSVQKWRGYHPKVITTGGGGLHHPDVKLALTMGFISFTLITLAVLWMRVRSEISSSRVAELEQEALELGLGEE